MTNPTDFTPPSPAWLAIQSLASVRRFFIPLIVLWSLRCAVIAGPFIDSHPRYGVAAVLSVWAAVIVVLLLLMPATHWLIRQWRRETDEH